MRPLLPPGASKPLVRTRRALVSPFLALGQLPVAGGLVLLLATALALLWANSPWADSYTTFWNLPLGFQAFGFTFERTLAWWVNDGLMTLFFFAVGLEIRHEIHDGSLSSLKQASLPLLAALGGMVVPALLYVLLTQEGPTRAGWGASMATDIAFALGILALLGKRVSNSLRVLLLALAVIDDLGAILVIAFFYSSGVSLVGLGIGALGLLGVWLLQKAGVRAVWAYVVFGLVAWAGVYAAGVHPTIAGVLLGFMTPVVAWYGPEGLKKVVNSPEAAEPYAIKSELKRAILEVYSPSERLLHALHPWVTFFIMPVFALANAGVSFEGMSLEGAGLEVSIALTLGLVLGKPLGIWLMCFLGLKLKLAQLPKGLNWRALAVLGVIAGIGFTMSLFVAQLGFSDEALLGSARLGVLAASAIAALLSLGLGMVLLKPPKSSTLSETETEAEAT